MSSLRSLLFPSVELPDTHVGMVRAHVTTECAHTKRMDIVWKALLKFWLI